jgi:hypothetical protein
LAGGCEDSGDANRTHSCLWRDFTSLRVDFVRINHSPKERLRGNGKHYVFLLVFEVLAIIGIKTSLETIRERIKDPVRTGASPLTFMVVKYEECPLKSLLTVNVWLFLPISIA